MSMNMCVSICMIVKMTMDPLSKGQGTYLAVTCVGVSTSIYPQRLNVGMIWKELSTPKLYAWESPTSTAGHFGSSGGQPPSVKPWSIHTSERSNWFLSQNAVEGLHEVNSPQTTPAYR